MAFLGKSGQVWRTLASDYCYVWACPNMPNWPRCNPISFSLLAQACPKPEKLWSIKGGQTGASTSQKKKKNSSSLKKNKSVEFCGFLLLKKNCGILWISSSGFNIFFWTLSVFSQHPKGPFQGHSFIWK